MILVDLPATVMTAVSPRPVAGALAIAAMATAFAGCAAPAETAAPVARMTVAVGQPVVDAGAPIGVQYRFERSAGAPALAEDYWVFVHMLDDHGMLLWTDDHLPPMPTSTWGSSAVDYQRSMFVPHLAYSGPVRIEAGLYSRSSGARLPLEGTKTGTRVSPVAFDMRQPSSPVFISYGDGWYGAEQAEGDAGRPWRWSSGNARLSFRHPGGDATLTLEIDQPVAAVGAQTVEIRRAADVLATIAIASGDRRVHRIVIPSNRLGGGLIDLDLGIRPTFVPASIAALGSRDTRELGVRLFNVHVGVEPAGAASQAGLPAGAGAHVP
jgi:hypothetical protein